MPGLNSFPDICPDIHPKEVVVVNVQVLPFFHFGTHAVGQRYPKDLRRRLDEGTHGAFAHQAEIVVKPIMDPRSRLSGAGVLASVQDRGLTQMEFPSSDLTSGGISPC